MQSLCPLTTRTVTFLMKFSPPLASTKLFSAYVPPGFQVVSSVAFSDRLPKSWLCPASALSSSYKITPSMQFHIHP
jgi:hypothetical protein